MPRVRFPDGAALCSSHQLTTPVFVPHGAPPFSRSRLDPAFSTQPNAHTCSVLPFLQPTRSYRPILTSSTLPPTLPHHVRETDAFVYISYPLPVLVTPDADADHTDCTPLSNRCHSTRHSLFDDHNTPVSCKTYGHTTAMKADLALIDRWA